MQKISIDRLYVFDKWVLCICLGCWGRACRGNGRDQLWRAWWGRVLDEKDTCCSHRLHLYPEEQSMKYCYNGLIYVWILCQREIYLYFCLTSYSMMFPWLKWSMINICSKVIYIYIYIYIYIALVYYKW
jgi:hypothetical protein